MPTFLILIFIFIFGLIIGSFLNCLIWRWHEKIPLTPFVKGGNQWRRSYCPKCDQLIAWYDNIPVISFILLKGRCRHCHKPISWQYPIVELVTGVLFTMAFINNFQFSIFPPRLAVFGEAGNLQTIFNFQFFILTLRDFFFIAVMIVIFVYDLRWYQILDIITIPACLAIFFLNLALGFSLHNLLISGIIGGSFFLLQFIISRGKWIGGGDIRLGLLLGFSLGWPGVILAIIISYFLGSIIGVGLIIFGKKKWGSEVPLGVFLASGGVITLFWQAQILNWYFSLF